MSWLQEGFVETAGRRLAYAEIGAPGDSPALVLLHGSGGSRENWVPLLRALSAKNVHAVALELPGHGKSPGPGLDRMDAYASVVRDFLSARPLDRPVLVGHSMGGAAALTGGLAFPEAIRALVVIGSGARLRVQDAILQGLLADFATTVEQIVEYTFAPGAPAGLLEEGRRRLLKCAPEVVHGDFLACNGFDAMDRLDEIRLPFLAICGREDRLTPPKYAEFLVERISGARLVLVEGAGHSVMIERPEEVADAVAEFLEEV